MKKILSTGLLIAASFVAAAQTSEKDVPKSAVPQNKNLLSGDQPTYPAAAKAAHIEGTVVLHIIVATDGTVESEEVVSGPPLLQAAALEAVKHWVYRPYEQNGVRRRVDTRVYLNFNLKDATK